MSSTAANSGTSEPKRSYQVVVMGGGGVGKSALTFRFVHNQFVEMYDPTIEDSYRKDNFMVDDEVCPVEIMDTAGQDTFTAMRDLYYKNGDGFLLVYSITDSSSVEDVKERYNSLITVRGVDPSSCPPVTLVGNKNDLEDQRVVSREQGMELAREMGPNVTFLETSAKNSVNVDVLFQDIVRNIKKAGLEKPTIAGMRGPRSQKKWCSIL